MNILSTHYIYSNSLNEEILAQLVSMDSEKAESWEQTIQSESSNLMGSVNFEEFLTNAKK